MRRRCILEPRAGNLPHLRRKLRSSGHGVLERLNQIPDNTRGCRKKLGNSAKDRLYTPAHLEIAAVCDQACKDFTDHALRIM